WPEDVAGREFIERAQNGGTTQGITAPGVGAFAIVEAGEEIGAAGRSRHGYAVPKPFAQDDDLRFQTIGLVGKEIAGPPKVRLHLVQDEHDILLATEALEQLQILLGWMERAAAAQVRLGDQRAEPATELVVQLLQLALVRRGMKRPVAHAGVGTLLHGKTDEAHPGIAVVIGLAAGHGPS